MKTTFISTSWRKQCPILTIFYKKILKVQDTQLFKPKILWKNSFSLLVSLPSTTQLATLNVLSPRSRSAQRIQGFSGMI